MTSTRSTKRHPLASASDPRHGLGSGLETPLCRRLGIALPIAQAPMGGASCPDLVAAVSNAGAFGMLAVSFLPLGEVPGAIAATRSLTERPFAVNLCLAWDQHERLRRCLDAGARVVSLFWGDPRPYVGTVRAAGALLVQTVGSAAEARRAVDAGADVLIAQGWEAGGHVWSEVATLALVPRVVDAAGATPVMAAGGIADGRGIAAVLMLGAAGACIGTRFLASDEAAIHPRYKERVLAASETDTVHTTLFDVGWPDAPHRTLRNETVARWEAAGRPASGQRPGEGEPIATLPDGTPVPRYSEVPPITGMTGDLDGLVAYAGQGAGLVRRLQPAADIVHELAAERVATLARAARLAAG
jgi:nitronate monooxygenase